MTSFASLRLHRLLVSILLPLSLLTFGGCDDVKKGLAQLDYAIYLFDQHSGDWQGIVRNIPNDLSKEVKEVIEEELAVLTARLAQDAGNQAKCTILYTNVLIQNELRRIRFRLLDRFVENWRDDPENKKYVEEEKALLPFVCNTVPRAIRFQDKEHEELTIDGWHFDPDKETNIRLFLLRQDSSTYEVTDPNIMAVNSIFTMTLNLSSLKSQIDKEVTKLQIRDQSGEKVLSEVLVFQEGRNLEPNLKISYNVHHHYGWSGWKTEGQMAGTSGRSLAIDVAQIRLENTDDDNGCKLKAYYHSQDVGDQDVSPSTQVELGTYGKRLEGIKLCLEGPCAKFYEIHYAGHVQGQGGSLQNDPYTLACDPSGGGSWLGTRGRTRRLEAIWVYLKRKE